MELPITPMLLTHPRARPALRNPDDTAYHLRQVKALVIHWTANTKRGADADNNRNYFNLGSRSASAHYIVDDRTIVQCIPDNEVAFHCGDKPEGRYRPAGLRLINGAPGFKRPTPNYYTIGIEMCVNEDGDWFKTYRHTWQLTALLMHRHGLGYGDLYRHLDITGKQCPRPMLKLEDWQTFIHHVDVAYREFTKYSIKRVTSTELNVRSGPGVSFPVVYQLRQGWHTPIFETHPSGWVRIGVGEWVNGKFLQ